MCFCHFKELNKNFVSVFIQGNFHIEVLCCKPEFSFHLVTPGGNCVFEIQTIFGQKAVLIICGGEGQWEEKHGEMIEWHFYLLVWLFRQGPPCFGPPENLSFLGWTGNARTLEKRIWRRKRMSALEMDLRSQCDLMLMSWWDRERILCFAQILIRKRLLKSAQRSSGSISFGRWVPFLTFKLTLVKQLDEFVPLFIHWWSTSNVGHLASSAGECRDLWVILALR